MIYTYKYVLSLFGTGSAYFIYMRYGISVLKIIKIGKLFHEEAESAQIKINLKEGDKACE